MSQSDLPEDELIRQLAESGQATPDPSWPYFGVWQISAVLAKQHQVARELLSEAEDAHPEVDDELVRCFQGMRESCDSILRLLMWKGNQ